MSWQKYLLLPQVIWHALRAPKGEVTTWERYWEDVGRTGEALALPGDSGLTIITYTVEPHSASAQALDFLASWATQAVPNAGETSTVESGPATGP